MKLYHELAEFYFAIENNHRDINNDVAFIRSLLHSRKSPTLLDIGCATGEHLNLLNRYGIKCTGIDNSRNILRIAKLRHPGKIIFLEKNMNDFDFYKEFDISISLFGSFNYMIEDNDVDKTLWNTWRALKPDGTGIFEIWNAMPIEKIKIKDLSHISTTTIDKDIKIKRERGFKILDYYNKTVVEVNYKYTIMSAEGSKTIKDKHIMRTFNIDEIRKFTSNNGLRIQAIYSSFLKETYKDNSNRMIIHFIKED